MAAVQTNSLESYFIGKEKCIDEFKHDKVIQKRIGRLAGFATQQYKTKESVKVIDKKTSTLL